MQVEASDAFEKSLRSLLKRHRSILDDLQPLIEALENNQRPGDKIPNTGFDVYKVRIKNSDIGKGKSAGYRAIYYIQTGDRIILITLYAKSDQSNISSQAIREIIHDIENS
jgi:mRNA-degrading endonuclease RelE of RelBE toxin-antitoxin system